MSALGAVRPESKEPERNRAPRVGKIARGFGDYTTGLNTWRVSVSLPDRLRVGLADSV